MAHFTLLLALASLIVLAFSQSNDLTWSGTGSSLCNESFSDANVTGSYTYNPGVPQFDSSSGFAKDIYVGVTVAETSSSAEWALWFNSGGANYTDDLALGYDACLFTIETTTTNTVLRGQSDNGNCAQTLDADCKTALQDMADTLALGLVNNATPNPGSNLSAGSLPHVCYSIANSMQDDFPKACVPFFEDSPTVAGAALTSYGPPETATARCSLKDASTNRTYQHVLTISGSDSRHNYLTFNYFLVPFLLTYFPVANINAKQSIGNPNSFMACPRANHINPGSESVPAPATPTPVGGGGGGLSGGDIAGVVVGVVGGVALIAGAAFWFWRRSKKAKQTKAEDDTPPAYTADKNEQPTAPTPLVEAPAGGEVAELGSGGVPRQELAGEPKLPPQEKDADAQPPAELLADVPGHGK